MLILISILGILCTEPNNFIKRNDLGPWIALGVAVLIGLGFLFYNYHLSNSGIKEDVKKYLRNTSIIISLILFIIWICLSRYVFNLLEASEVIIHLSALFAAFIALQIALKTDWAVESSKRTVRKVNSILNRTQKQIESHVLNVQQLEDFQTITKHCERILDLKTRAGIPIEITNVKLMTYISAVGLMGTINFENKSYIDVPNEIIHPKKDIYWKFKDIFFKKLFLYNPKIQVISCKPEHVIQTYLRTYFFTKKKDDSICIKCKYFANNSPCKIDYYIENDRTKIILDYYKCIKKLIFRLNEFYNKLALHNASLKVIKEKMHPGIMQFLFVRYNDPSFNKPNAVIWLKPPDGIQWNKNLGIRMRENFPLMAEEMFNSYWKDSTITEYKKVEEFATEIKDIKKWIKILNDIKAKNIKGK